MPPSVDIWFLVVSNSTDGMGPCSVIWMYSAVNLRKKFYVTRGVDLRRCPQRGHTFCPISLSQQIACTKNMATRKGWPCRFYRQEIFCVPGVLSHIQSCTPSRFHTLERSRFPHSRVRAFVLVYSPVRITTCGNSSGGTEQRLERANSCRRQR